MNGVVKKVRDLDAAADVVRQYVGGKVKLAAVWSHLEGLQVDDLEVVSIATRMPLSRLQTLQRASGQQMSLLGPAGAKS